MPADNSSVVSISYCSKQVVDFHHEGESPSDHWAVYAEYATPGSKKSACTARRKASGNQKISSSSSSAASVAGEGDQSQSQPAEQKPLAATKSGKKKSRKTPTSQHTLKSDALTETIKPHQDQPATSPIPPSSSVAPPSARPVVPSPAPAAAPVAAAPPPPPPNSSRNSSISQ